MILNEFTDDNEQIDFSDSWTEEDLEDLSRFSLSHADDIEQA